MRGAQILHHLIRMQHIGPDLVAPAGIALGLVLGVDRRIALVEFQLIEPRFQRRHGVGAVLVLGFFRTGHHDAGGQMGDAVTVHGFCGAWGTLAAGLFFENQMFNAGIIAVQGLGIVTAFAWGFGVALIVFKVLDLVLGGLRVSKQHEQRGLDYTEHAELSYPEFQRDVTFETDDMTKRH